MTKESLGLYLIKLILTVSFIVVGGALLGTMAYSSVYPEFWTYSIVKPLVLENKINKIEVSADGKSIINAETKKTIFTIADTQKYLKDAGYFYNPDTFQTTNAKYAGDCFLDSNLSNEENTIINNNIVKKRIVFSSGCLSGDLPQAWAGVYYFGIKELTLDCSTVGKSCRNDKENSMKKPFFQFLIAGSGRNFSWSADDKTITYEADLGLSGLTEMRTIDSATGEILEKKNSPIINDSDIKDWKTYKNEEYGFEFKYPRNWIVEDLIKSSYFTTVLINPPIIRIKKPIYDAIAVNVDTASKINTVEKYLDKNILIDPNTEPQEIKKFTELFPNYIIVKIDNTDGVQYKNKVAGIETSTQKIINTVLPTNKGVIELITDEDYKDIYSQILSTFKFIEPEK